VDEHLAPVLANITARVNVGRRTLWGSLASAVAYGLSRAAEVVPGPVLPTASTILDALGVTDLVALAPRADGQAGLDIQRRTCCLAFTLPEPKVCSGCCIR
jgi:ferric iron reductase protein FhuF